MKNDVLHRNDDYRRYIQRQPCVVHKIYGMVLTGDDGRVEHAHAHNGGKGIKGSDYEALPLCHRHHIEFDNGKGRRTFQEKYPFLDIDKEIIRLLIGYIEEKREKGALKIKPQHVVDYEKTDMYTTEIIKRHKISQATLYRDLRAFDVPLRNSEEDQDRKEEMILDVFYDLTGESRHATKPSLREIRDAVAERGIEVSHEWVRQILKKHNEM